MNDPQLEMHGFPDVPDALRAQWEIEAARRDPVLALTRTPAWFAMMTSGRASPPAVAAWRDSAGKYVGVLPFHAQDWTLRMPVAGMQIPVARLRVARAFGGDLLAQGLDGEAVRAFLAGVLERAAPIDGILFDHVEEGENLDRLLSAFRGDATRLAAVLTAGRPHYRLALPADVAGLREMRSAKSVSKIHGRERAMQKALGADCRLIELRGCEDWAPYGERIEALMNRAWQAEALDHRFTVGDMARAAERGWNRSFLLCVGERAAAFAFGYQGMGTLTYVQIGYDRELGKYSPGTILLYRLLDRLYECDRPAFVDFGEGEADYKAQLANNIISVASVLVLRAGAWRRGLLRLRNGMVGCDATLRRAAKSTALGRRLARRIRSG